MGADLVALIRAVLTDQEERLDFVAGFIVLVFGMAVLYIGLFLAAGAIGR